LTRFACALRTTSQSQAHRPRPVGTRGGGKDSSRGESFTSRQLARPVGNRALFPHVGNGDRWKSRARAGSAQSWTPAGASKTCLPVVVVAMLGVSTIRRLEWTGLFRLESGRRCNHWPPQEQKTADDRDSGSSHRRSPVHDRSDAGTLIPIYGRPSDSPRGSRSSRGRPRDCGAAGQMQWPIRSSRLPNQGCAADQHPVRSFDPGRSSRRPPRPS